METRGERRLPRRRHFHTLTRGCAALKSPESSSSLLMRYVLAQTSGEIRSGFTYANVKPYLSFFFFFTLIHKV